MTIRDYVICISQVTCFELRNWPRARSLPLAFLLPLFPILAPTSIFSSVLAPTPPPSLFLRAAVSLFLPFHPTKPEECSSDYLSTFKKTNKPVPTSASIFIAWDDNWICPLLKKHQNINTISFLALFIIQIVWTLPCLLQWRTRQHLFCFYSVPHEIWKRENGKIQ